MCIRDKWKTLADGMYRVQQAEGAFQMRRRLNPHHTKVDVKLETERHTRLQLKKFIELKAFYVENRNELVSDPEILSEYTEEHQLWEKLVQDDMERLVFDHEHDQD